MRKTLLTMAALAAAAAAVVFTIGGATASSGSGFVACNNGDSTDAASTGIYWSPTTLWPPNHKLATVTISYHDATDNDGSALGVKINSITSSQGSASTGTGNTGSGTEGTGSSSATTTVQLTSERSGGDPNGNVYTISVTCTEFDEPGHHGDGPPDTETETKSITVNVQHDQGG